MQAEQHFVIILLTACVIQATCFTLPARTRYCGNNLADALKLACGEYGYNVPWENEPDDTDKHKHPYVRSLGVATECCYFGCSYSTLKSYCAYPKASSSRKSSGEDQSRAFDKIESPSEPASEYKGVKDGDIMAIAPEVELDNIVRSAPVFGTVSPEYLRLPRTLDELPSIHIGMQEY